MTKNILVVDDDKMLRMSLAKGLRQSGFDVILAKSAEDATQILNRISMDAIILDRMMVGMDGLSFLKQLRQSGNTVPVIMLTALSGSENTIEGLSGGADDYMAKPFKLQELVLRLNNIIRKKPANSENNYNIGIVFNDEEFFIINDENSKKLLSLSNEEKKLLYNLINPIGNIVSAMPMVAKRLRNKINGVLSGIDIITVRGMGYKIVNNKTNG